MASLNADIGGFGEELTDDDAASSKKTEKNKVIDYMKEKTKEATTKSKKGKKKWGEKFKIVKFVNQ